MTPEEYYNKAIKIFNRFYNDLSDGRSMVMSGVALEYKITNLALDWNSVEGSPRLTDTEIRQFTESVESKIHSYLYDPVNNHHFLSINSPDSLLRDFNMPKIIEDSRDPEIQSLFSQADNIQKQINELKQRIEELSSNR